MSITDTNRPAQPIPIKTIPKRLTFGLGGFSWVTVVSNERTSGVGIAVSEGSRIGVMASVGVGFLVGIEV
jgi:hypothetical protein